MRRPPASQPACSPDCCRRPTARRSVDDSDKSSLPARFLAPPPPPPTRLTSPSHRVQARSESENSFPRRLLAGGCWRSRRCYRPPLPVPLIGAILAIKLAPQLLRSRIQPALASSSRRRDANDDGDADDAEIACRVH